MKQNQKTKSTLENKPTLVAFLLDRSGSMSSCREETISGFNAYVAELKKNAASGMIFTLTQFDTQGIDILHDGVPVSKVHNLDTETFVPRGGTPLYDAMGKTINAAREKAGSKFKVLFVSLTDGQENASSEWNSETIKTLIKEREEKDKWTFAYIGVGLNGFAATQAVSKGTLGASNVLRSDPKNMKRSYTRMAAVACSYSADAATAHMSAKNVWGGANDGQ